ncbi:MAG: arsenic resistance N-acetyltransferase ArsN2 [Cyanobacteria bacterium J06626_18]
MSNETSNILELRTATASDLPLIQQWLSESGLPTEDIPQILDCLYLGIDQEAVVGIGGIERHGKDGLLRSLVIVPPFRQQGYGRLLCRQLINQAKTEEMQALYLLTNTADQFFAQLGFERIARPAAPATMQRTTEFSSLCPDSAICMRLYLRQSEQSHP